MSLDAMAAQMLHGIGRAEWEQRFRDQVKRLADVGDDIADAELDSWPEDDEDWRTELPESAAIDNLSYWTDDGE